MSLAILIFAVEDGSTFKSRRPKALHAIGGKPMLAHCIAAASKVVAPENIFVLAGDQAERIEAEVAIASVCFLSQAAPNALESIRNAIAGYDDVLILPGDLPLIRPETIEVLLQHHRQGAAMTILTTEPQNPKGNEAQSVTGAASRSSVQAANVEIASALYAFKTAPLLAHWTSPSFESSAGTDSIAPLASILLAAGHSVAAFQAPQPLDLTRVNSIAELVALDAKLRERTAERLMRNGVTIFRPETCVIDNEVEVGPDTVIEPNVQLLGKTRIGSGCLIRSGTVIENAILADEVIIRQNCVVTESSIGSGAKIGPFAHLRPGSEIGEEAHIGNFVETKMARLGKGAKASHLTYLGDADIGAGSNIGAGVITCNYDGVHKHRTKIGAGAFIGSDSTLVAPITIGDGAYVGAGSCITREVPADALSVARGRQVTKEGWAAAKRKRQSEECS